MKVDLTQIRPSLLHALQVDLIGPSGALGDHGEVVPHVPSRWYVTGFPMPTDADEDQRYDPNSDDEMDPAPAISTVDKIQAPEQAVIKRFSKLNSSADKSSSVATSSPEHQARDQARAIFQGSIDAKEDLTSREE